MLKCSHLHISNQIIHICHVWWDLRAAFSMLLLAQPIDCLGIILTCLSCRNIFCFVELLVASICPGHGCRFMSCLSHIILYLHKSFARHSYVILYSSSIHHGYFLYKQVNPTFRQFRRRQSMTTWHFINNLSTSFIFSYL